MRNYTKRVIPLYPGIDSLDEILSHEQQLDSKMQYVFGNLRFDRTQEEARFLRNEY
jgi:hypothetical protein